MPVTLRKRKTPPPPPERPAKKKAAPKAAPKAKGKGVKNTVVEKAKEVKEAVKETVAGTANGEEKPAEKPVEEKPAEEKPAAGPPKVGDTIDLSGFGGEVETQDGKKTTLAKLVEESQAGVVLFTYPKASTPGCTTQVCLFRDSYTPLTSTGFSIYGLSNDSPKANTTFKTKQKLPYDLLCNPSSTLIKAIGLGKTPKGTTRGVFVVDKSGKVLASEPGGPAATVEVVKKLVGDSAPVPSAEEAEKQEEQEKQKEDAAAAKTADEVADTAAKIDSA